MWQVFRAQGLLPPVNRSADSPLLTDSARPDVTACTTAGPRERASCSRWVHPFAPPNLLCTSRVNPLATFSPTSPAKAGAMPGHSAWGKVSISAADSVMVMSAIRTVTRSSMSCTRVTACPSRAHGRVS